ncbi:hypothetical protein F5Y16DRAFT_393008 [Xylariaceae sp. FL0255]|nr:hypothetical protein F5Y16DRAFT_393008 [Xylariaceae sp. FL0255]
MAYALAVPVMSEAVLATSLAPVVPFLGPALVLGVASWRLTAWWKASTAAAAAKAAAAKAAAAKVAAAAAAAAEIATANAAAAASMAAEVVAAEAASAAVVAAPAAAEAAAESAVGAATAFSIPVLVMSGAVVIAVVGGCYYLYKQRHPATPRKASSSAPSNSSKDPEDEENRRSDRRSRGKKIMITKKEMEKLLGDHGEPIWKKLKALGPDKLGKIWNNQNYRVDVGPKVHGHPNLRNWNLQVNREAESAVKDLLKTDTHDRLFCGKFDTVAPPDLDTFKREIFEQFP